MGSTEALAFRYGLAQLMRIDKLWLSVLILAAASSLAQDPSSPLDRVAGCQRQNSSRLPADECGLVGPPVLISHNFEMSTVLAVPEIESLHCEAVVWIQYDQRNTLARVEGTIENGDCAASSGSFRLSVQTKAADGELKLQEFSQTWRRADDRPIAFVDELPIGADVDLVRVRANEVQCRCASPL